MKKGLLILSLAASPGVFGQQFAPVGASWVYNDHEAAGYHNYPRGINSVADTVINGTDCRIVIGDCICSSMLTNYLYDINRRVYHYDPTMLGFSLLYDFNLNAGEQYVYYPPGAIQDSFIVSVDSVGSDVINGNLLKVQYVHPVAFSSTLNYIFPGRIIENIGSTGCLYPQFASCDPPTSGLRCYTDSVLGFYDTHFAPSCEVIFMDSGIGMNELENEILVTVSPNPFSEVVFIKIHSRQPVAEGIFSCVDVAGRIIVEEKIAGNELKLHRGNMSEGIYLFHIKSENGILAAGKLIIDQ